jgi:isocitrate/isopropylmalate dehydrogenase
MTKNYKIAVVHGDGIGPEVCQAAVEVLKSSVASNVLEFIEYPAAAQHFLSTGDSFPASSFAGCRGADAILRQRRANPYGTILASALMLRRLYKRHHDERLNDGANRIERAVESALADSELRSRDIGGSAGSREIVSALVAKLSCFSPFPS